MSSVPNNGPCRACGACCRVIPLGFDLFSPEMFEKAKKLRSAELRFLQLHWRPITLAKAREGHPHRKFKKSDGPWHIYTCIKLTDDGRCSVHDDKPYACKGYPWYGKPPRPAFAFASPNCGFIPEYMEAQAMRQRLIDVLHRIIRRKGRKITDYYQWPRFGAKTETDQRLITALKVKP